VYVETTYAVSSRAGPWACFELTVLPFRVLSHLFLMLLLLKLKPLHKNLAGGMRRIGKSSFMQQNFPTKTAGTVSIVLLALHIVDVDRCITYCVTGPCSLKSNVFLLQTFSKDVFSVFSKSMLL